MTDCVCGHPDFEHPDSGECERPTCECPAFDELCGQCRHPKGEHTSTGRCARVIRRAGPQLGQPCGCTRYPAVS